MGTKNKKTTDKNFIKTKEKFRCPECDGCGWTEGGKTIKTICKNCKGTGYIWINRAIPKADYKWNFAIGTTSRVPGCKGFHYLIIDIDGKENHNDVFNRATYQLGEIGCDWVYEETQHGFHIYTSFITSFKESIILAGLLGADRSWLRIGEGRGYLYLADKTPIRMGWPVERMLIYAKKEA